MIEEKKEKVVKLSKLQKQEKKLLEQIDEMGLIRHVTHEEVGFKRVEGEHGDLYISHETCVELYVGQHWKNVDKDRKLGKVTEFPRDLLTPVGIGFARCSVMDQFNRKVGRVIATSRAIRSYINYEVGNGRGD